MSGSFVSQGQITATANGANGKAYGIYVSDHSGSLTVTEDISVTGAGEAYAIYLGTGSGQLTLENTAEISGKIRVASHNVALNATAAGGDVTYTFEDTDTANGVFSTTSSDPTRTWFSTGAGTSAPVYTLISSQSSTVSPAIATDIAGLQADIDLGGTSRPAPVTSRGSFGLTQLLPSDQPPLETFVKGKLARNERDDGTTHSQAVTVGVKRSLAQLVDRFALALSFGNLKQDTDTMDTQLRGVTGTAMAQRDFDRSSFDLALSYGRFNHDNRRLEGGTNNIASSDQSSQLLSVKFGGSYDVKTTQNQRLTAFGSQSFGRVFMDGYTETGATANVTLGDYKVDFAETTLGAKLTESLEHGDLTFSAAWIGRKVISPNDLSVTVFGQNTQISTGLYRFEKLCVLGHEL